MTRNSEILDCFVVALLAMTTTAIHHKNAGSTLVEQNFANFF